MHELTTHNMPQHLLTSSDDLARAIPAALELITDPDAQVTVTYPGMRATVDSDMITVEADYDGRDAHATFRFTNGFWECTSVDANNTAMRDLVLKVVATLSNEGIISGGEYSITVNRLYLATQGAF